MFCKKALIIVIAVAIILSPLCYAEEVKGTTLLEFSELYQYGPEGFGYSYKIKSLAGKMVRMKGYMAPPLKPELDFFVLSGLPIGACPFCAGYATPPEVAVYPKGKIDDIDTGTPLSVEGILEIGPKTDEKTGFASFIRLLKASISILKQ